MSITFLNKTKTRLRVKQGALPRSLTILGNMLDATQLPEGHLACSKCSGYKFEASGYPGGSKMELGCINCNERVYIMFPMSCAIPEGRFICKRHPNKAMIVIHNVETVCVGCESCKTEMHIVVKDKGGLILADG
jgi:hypothetical protein